MEKCRHFYCQLDYRHIPYPSLTSPNGNIADNCCGVCCGSMVIEHFTQTDFPPELCAVFAKQSGAREGFGTDMSIFAPAISQRFHLNVVKTTDESQVLKFLQEKKGWVIANTAGDREGWIGVFSDSRHYVVLTDAKQHEVEVLDPLLQDGRYELPGRKGKVQLKGFYAYADFDVIVNDCNGRPYYMFSKEKQ